MIRMSYDMITFVVLAQVNPASFETADPEEIVFRILEMLRIFKYRPPDDVTPGDFRQGIIDCDKDILTHIMAYLFEKREELKKRAYLAKYLVKIEVSAEVEGDNDIVQLYQQVYDQQYDFQSH